MPNHFRIFLPDDLGGGVLTVAIGEDSMKAKATIVDLKQQILDHTCQQRRATLGSSGKFDVKNYKLWYPPQPGTDGVILPENQLVLSLAEPDLFFISTASRTAEEDLTQFFIGGLKHARLGMFIVGDARGDVRGDGRKLSRDTELTFLYHDQSPYVHVRNSYGQYLSSQDSGNVFFTKQMGPWSQWVVEDEPKVKSSEGHLQYLFNVDGHYLQLGMSGRVGCSDLKSSACRFVSMGPKISGWLKRKTTSKFSRYQKRYFTLMDKAIYCWDNEEAAKRAPVTDFDAEALIEVGGNSKKKKNKERNVFQMSQITEIAWATLQEKNFSISLLPAMGVKPLELLAENPQEARVWVEHIFRAKQHYDNEGFRLPSSKGTPVPPSTAIGCQQKQAEKLDRQTKHLSLAEVEAALDAVAKRSATRAAQVAKEEEQQKLAEAQAARAKAATKAAAGADKSRKAGKGGSKAGKAAGSAKQDGGGAGAKEAKKAAQQKKNKQEQMADDFGLTDLTLGSDLGDFTLGSDLDDSSMLVSPKPRPTSSSTNNKAKATKAATPKKSPRASGKAASKKTAGSKKAGKKGSSSSNNSEDEAASELKRAKAAEAAAKARTQARLSKQGSTKSLKAGKKAGKAKKVAAGGIKGKTGGAEKQELDRQAKAEAAARERMLSRQSSSARSPVAKKAESAKKNERVPAKASKRRDSFDLSMASSLDLGLTDADETNGELTLGLSDDSQEQLEGSGGPPSPRKILAHQAVGKAAEAKAKVDKAKAARIAKERTRQQRISGLARQKEIDWLRKEAADKAKKEEKAREEKMKKEMSSREAKVKKEEELLEARLSRVREQSERLRQEALEEEIRKRVEDEKRKMAAAEEEAREKAADEERLAKKEAAQKEAKDRKLQEELELRKRQTQIMQEQIDKEQRELKALLIKHAEDKVKQEQELEAMQRQAERKKQEVAERAARTTHDEEMKAKLELLRREEMQLQRLKASGEKRKRALAMRPVKNEVTKRLQLEQEVKEEVKEERAPAASPRAAGSSSRIAEMFQLLEDKTAEVAQINERHAKLKRTLAGRKQDFARLAHKFKTLKAQQNQKDDEELKKVMRGIKGQSAGSEDWKAVSLIWQRRYERSRLELNSLKLQQKHSAVRRQEERDRASLEALGQQKNCQSCAEQEKKLATQAAQCSDLGRQLADSQGAMLRQERHHASAMRVARIEAENLQEKHLHLMERMVESSRAGSSDKSGGGELEAVRKELSSLKERQQTAAALAKRQEEMCQELESQLAGLQQNCRRLTAENNSLLMKVHRRTTTQYQSQSIKEKAYVSKAPSEKLLAILAKESRRQEADGIRQSEKAPMPDAVQIL